MNAALVVLADHWHHGGSGWWFLFVPLAWGLVIVTAIWIARSTGAFGSRTRWHRETPTDVLERRFAEGRIDAEELRERRSVLEERGRQP